MSVHITQDCVECSADVALLADGGGIGMCVGDWDEDPTASISRRLRLRDIAVRNIGRTIRSSIGFYALHWQHSLLQRIEVEHVPYIGIMLGGSWEGNAKVTGNRVLDWVVRDAMSGAHDGGGLYAHKKQSDVKASRGFVETVFPHESESLFFDRAPALYMDNDCEGVEYSDIVTKDVDLCAVFNEITNPNTFVRVYTDTDEVITNGSTPSTYQAPIESADPAVTAEGAVIVAAARIAAEYRTALLEPVAGFAGEWPMFGAEYDVVATELPEGGEAVYDGTLSIPYGEYSAEATAEVAPDDADAEVLGTVPFPEGEYTAVATAPEEVEAEIIGTVPFPEGVYSAAATAGGTLCTITMQLSDIDGDPPVGVKALLIIEQTPQEVDDAYVLAGIATAESDSNGLITFPPVLRGARVLIRVNDIGYLKEVAVPDQATLQL